MLEQQIQELLQQGKTQRQIAVELGTNVSKINRIIKRLKQDETKPKKLKQNETRNNKSKATVSQWLTYKKILLGCVF